MKAIALLSGGLDSTLAAKIVQGLGIELIAFNTISPFCLCNHRSATGCFHGASAVAKDLGIRFLCQDVAEEFLEIVKAPAHGYGSNINPCIDCRILLFKKAREIMAKEGAAFVITGEVVGQRPMSQQPRTLILIEKAAGLEGLVVRPLSAGVLAPSIPEQNGWIPRERLLAFHGRGRREQFDLAEKFGINDYPCPSGGCLLTDPSFSKRVKDLINHNELILDNVKLLKVGRHFRLSEKAKLVVGRNEEENERLLVLAQDGDYLFTPPEEIAGPNALVRGALTAELIEFCVAAVARYCDASGNGEFTISYSEFPKKENHSLKARPMAEEALLELRI